MNNGWRHIDGASKKASKVVVGSLVLLVFIHIIGKRLLGTASEKDYENTSCMFAAIPLRCEVQYKGKHLSSQTDFWRAKILAKKCSYLSLEKNVTFRL